MLGYGSSRSRKGSFQNRLFKDSECPGENAVLLGKCVGRELERGLWPGIQWRKVLRLNSAL